MKRFHIALAVASIDASIADYTQRLGQPPTVVVPGAYAMWRTDLLNFSINQAQDSAQAGLLRHIGFEDDSAAGFAKTRDINGIEWEQFSPAEQDQRIEEIYGNAIRQGRPA
jgi:catechol 2,3-dioxygenase-like lactoylglutathione lyase family enzyme